MNATINNTTERLAKVACDVAGQAFAKYIHSNNLKVLDYDAAGQALRFYVKGRLNKALDDAKEAIDCNMGQIAEATFKAEMALAGIEAAKETGWPMDYQQ